MSDAAWLRAQVAKTEEGVRSFAQTLRRLTAEQTDLHRLWPDQAGRDFAQRYLSPLIADLDRAYRQLVWQLDQLAAAAEHGRGLDDALRRLYSLTEEVALAVSAVTTEAARVEDHSARATEESATARSITAEVATILSSLD